MKPSYQSLCTEFYDLTMLQARDRELTFYKNLLINAKGPILEAMCGSGRVLIPLLQEGLVLDGVDNSPFMLESCRQRCKNQGLTVELYNQPIQKLSLPKTYNIIFITIGSFQLIYDLTQALNTLKVLRQHLLPDGKLILENFIPWKGIKTGIHDSIIETESSFLTSESKTHTLDNSEIRKYTKIKLNFKNQLVRNQTLYEKWKDDKLILEEEEEYLVRWYYRFEMQLFLENAGFSSVEIHDESFNENPGALIYIAHKSNNQT